MYYVIADKADKYGCLLIKADNQAEVDQRLLQVNEESIIGAFTNDEITALVNCRFGVVSAERG